MVSQILRFLVILASIGNIYMTLARSPIAPSIQFRSNKKLWQHTKVAGVHYASRHSIPMNIRPDGLKLHYPLLGIDTLFQTLHIYNQMTPKLCSLYGTTRTKGFPDYYYIGKQTLTRAQLNCHPNNILDASTYFYSSKYNTPLSARDSILHTIYGEEVDMHAFDETPIWAPYYILQNGTQYYLSSMSIMTTSKIPFHIHNSTSGQCLKILVVAQEDSPPDPSAKLPELSPDLNLLWTRDPNRFCVTRLKKAHAFCKTSGVLTQESIKSWEDQCFGLNNITREAKIALQNDVLKFKGKHLKAEIPVKILKPVDKVSRLNTRYLSLSSFPSQNLLRTDYMEVFTEIQKIAKAKMNEILVFKSIINNTDLDIKLDPEGRKHVKSLFDFVRYLLKNPYSLEGAFYDPWATTVRMGENKYAYPPELYYILEDLNTFWIQMLDSNREHKSLFTEKISQEPFNLPYFVLNYEAVRLQYSIIRQLAPITLLPLLQTNDTFLFYFRSTKQLMYDIMKVALENRDYLRSAVRAYRYNPNDYTKRVTQLTHMNDRVESLIIDSLKRHYEFAHRLFYSVRLQRHTYRLRDDYLLLQQTTPYYNFTNVNRPAIIYDKKQHKLGYHIASTNQVQDVTLVQMNKVHRRASNEAIPHRHYMFVALKLPNLMYELSQAQFQECSNHEKGTCTYLGEPLVLKNNTFCLLRKIANIQPCSSDFVKTFSLYKWEDYKALHNYKEGTRVKRFTSLCQEGICPFKYTVTFTIQARYFNTDTKEVRCPVNGESFITLDFNNGVRFTGINKIPSCHGDTNPVYYPVYTVKEGIAETLSSPCNMTELFVHNTTVVTKPFCHFVFPNDTSQVIIPGNTTFHITIDQNYNITTSTVDSTNISSTTTTVVEEIDEWSPDFNTTDSLSLNNTHFNSTLASNTITSSYAFKLSCTIIGVIALILTFCDILYDIGQKTQDGE